jgi:hypothetical protein
MKGDHVATTARQPGAVRGLKLAIVTGLVAGLAGCPAGSPNSSTTGNPEAAAAPDLSELETDHFTPETGFRLLTVADFDHFPADAQTWSQVGKTIVCSGTPKGYAYTREPFENFTLRCEFRYVVAGAPPEGAEADKYNTGFMLHIQEPHKVWPLSMEVQGRYDQISWVKGNGGASATEVVDDTVGRQAARLPVGQWNAVEILSRDGAISSRLNGMVISTCKPSGLTSGPLGLQAEGFAVHFKHLRVRVDE